MLIFGDNYVYKMVFLIANKILIRNYRFIEGLSSMYYACYFWSRKTDMRFFWYCVRTGRFCYSSLLRSLQKCPGRVVQSRRFL